MTVLAAVLAWLLVRNAWRQTELREAYLTDLLALAKQDPANGPAQVALAGREAQARQYRRAAESFRRAIAAGENSAPVWLAWSACEAEAGYRPLAGAALLLGMRQPTLQSPLGAALDRFRKLPPGAAPGQVAEAICPEGPAAVIAPYISGSFLNRLASWYGRRRPGASGFTTREAWARAEPNSAQAQLLWADALDRNQCYAQAQTASARALQLSPACLSAQLDLADALYHQGQAGKAGVLYAQMARAHPNSLRALLGLGQVALDNDIRTVALQVFSRAVKLAPGSADAWAGLGKAYLKESLDLNKAIAAYGTAARLDPHGTYYFADYASALRIQTRYAEAESLLRRRLAADPDDAQAHYYLGLTLLDDNVTPARRAEAEQQLRAALAIQPDGISTLTRLGRLLADESRCAEAVAPLQQALRLDPDNVSAALALERADRALGRTNDAASVSAHLTALTSLDIRRRTLEDELKMSPLNPKLYKQMAQLYMRLGQPQQARNYAEAATVLLKNPRVAGAGLLALRRQVSVGLPAPQSPGAASRPVPSAGQPSDPQQPPQHASQ